MKMTLGSSEDMLVIYVNRKASLAKETKLILKEKRESKGKVGEKRY